MCICIYIPKLHFPMMPAYSLIIFPLLHMQSVMPEGALVEAWSKSAHKLWVGRLRRTSHLTELLQVYFIISFSFFLSVFKYITRLSFEPCIGILFMHVLQVLADFVGAINEDWLCQSDVELGSNSLFEEIILSFSAMPQTLSSVALWLVKLDALIAPHLKRVQLLSKTRTRN